MSEHCRVMVRDGYNRFGKSYCRRKPVRNGMCTQHANQADRQQARRAALSSKEPRS